MITPLHFAARYNSDPTIVAELLEGGAKPGARTGKGATALLLAAIFDRDPAVALALLKSGADPNAKAQWKVTPLHLAAWRSSNPAVLMVLLNKGADPKITINGDTAFDLAKKNRKLAGSAAYGRLREAHEASKAERRAVRQKADGKSQTQGADKAAPESVTWRGDFSVGKELKPGEGCRIMTRTSQFVSPRVFGV